MKSCRPTAARPPKLHLAARESALLLVGIAACACMDSINGTALSVAALQVKGGTGSSPDAFAWANTVYVAARFYAFALSPWLYLRFGSRRTVVFSAAALLVSSALGGLTTSLHALVAVRALQGLSGAAFLISGQAALFERFVPRAQGLAQAVLALATVVVPNALAPALQGWLADRLAWPWIFYVGLPIGTVGLWALGMASSALSEARRKAGADPLSLLALAAALPALVFVLQEGTRWNWFEAQRVAAASLVAGFGLTIFLWRQFEGQGGPALLEHGVFRDPDFSFGFIVSFVAGFALFGSAFLIPRFAVGVLGFTATDTGLLLLPSAACIAIGLFVVGGLISARDVSPLAFVPFGIGLLMWAMWMLSRSTGTISFGDLGPPLLLRGLGVGLLFLSLTMFTLGHLRGRAIVHGVALFNIGRQLGGVIGVGCLQTLLADRKALDGQVLLEHLSRFSPLFAATQAHIGALLGAGGLGPVAGSLAALPVIRHMVQSQVAVLSFNEAFLAVALLFLIAAPVLVAIKIVLQRSLGERDPRHHPVRNPTM